MPHLYPISISFSLCSVSCLKLFYESVLQIVLCTPAGCNITNNLNFRLQKVGKLRSCWTTWANWLDLYNSQVLGIAGACDSLSEGLAAVQRFSRPRGNPSLALLSTCSVSELPCLSWLLGWKLLNIWQVLFRFLRWIISVFFFANNYKAGCLLDWTLFSHVLTASQNCWFISKDFPLCY